MKVLIMGLPGSGKTTLASELIPYLEEHGWSVLWLNADRIREEYDDWDFSEEGRIRQSSRMRDLANNAKEDIVIADFIAPLPENRNGFNPDILIWMDTISKGRYEDTNIMFVPPEITTFRFRSFDKVDQAFHVAEEINKRKRANDRKYKQS